MAQDTKRIIATNRPNPLGIANVTIKKKKDNAVKTIAGPAVSTRTKVGSNLSIKSQTVTGLNPGSPLNGS